MTASEQLRALERVIRDEVPDDAEPALWSLKPVLPLIADVIEAAERTTEAWHGPGGTGMLNTTHSRQRAALTALTAALPALPWKESS